MLGRWEEEDKGVERGVKVSGEWIECGFVDMDGWVWFWGWVVHPMWS